MNSKQEITNKLDIIYKNKNPIKIANVRKQLNIVGQIIGKKIKKIVTLIKEKDQGIKKIIMIIKHQKLNKNKEIIKNLLIHTNRIQIMIQTISNVNILLKMRKNS